MTKRFLFSVLLLFAQIYSANAENISKNTAHMQAMDKITGRVSVIDVPVDGKVDFGSFSIVVRSCQTRSAEEIPDSFAFVDVTDTDLSGEKNNIFRGWMIASSPATNAVEHPIYDVWLLQCIDKETDKSLLLSAEELEEINNTPAAKSTEDPKAVADSINEMQYKNEQKEETPTEEKTGENTLLEFEMDEESAENQTEKVADEQ